MAPEERLSEAIDRLLAGEEQAGRDLSREEERLLALARRLRSAQADFWPVDEAAFQRRLLAGFELQPRVRWRRAFAAGAAAAAVVAALLLGQPGTDSGPTVALLLPPKAAARTPATPTFHATAHRSGAQAAASFVAAAPMQTTAGPGAPLKTSTTYSTAAVVQVPARPLQAKDLGFGLVALRFPAPQALRGGLLHATSLSGRHYEVAAALVQAPKGSGVAVLQTSGLPGGWYRLPMDAGEAALFVPSSSLVARRSGWISVQSDEPGMPFAVRFTATRTEAALPIGETWQVKLVGTDGAEAPLWSSVRTVRGRRALVLVFNPTPAGTRSLHFLVTGQERLLDVP